MINKRLLGKCYEECFQYYEAVCFKSFPYEYQIILLKLAFFHTINKELLTEVFGYTEKDSMRILNELTASFGALIFCGEDEYQIEDFLRIFLQKKQTAYLGVGEMSSLYAKAYEYYFDKEDWLEAIRYADLNGDIQGVVNCLHETCINNELYAGYLELETYMRTVPESYIMGDAVLLYAYAYMEAVYGNKKRAEHYVHLVEKQLEDRTMEEEEYKQFSWIYGLMKVGLPYQRVEHLEEQIDYLDSRQDAPKFKLSISGGIPSLLHGGRDFCSYMNADRSRIHEICKKLPLILQDDYDGFEETVLGEMEYERGNFKEAVTLLSQGAGKAMRGGETSLVANLVLIKIMYHKNEPEQAVHILKSLDQSLERLNNQYSRKNLEAFRIYKNMLSGEWDPVMTWLERSAPTEQDVFIIMERYRYVVKIYAYIMLGKIENALLILYRTLEYAREYGRTYDEWNMRILEVIIRYRQGEDSWQDLLSGILEETKEVGMVRIYADKGALLFPVLKKYTEEKKIPKEDSYFFKIMEHTKREALLYPNFMANKKGYEELSVQEMDVLRLLCQGKKNADIAKELFLSENTVKYHLKKVYQKLNAASRSEAIARAREERLV